MMRIRHILLTLLLLLAAGARAEGDITHLDWKVLRIDSVMPVYSETVPLAADYADYDFCVKVEYPEWVPLTADEERMAQLHDVPTTLQPTWQVGVLNHRGMLDIEFVPLILSKDGYRKLVSCRITIEAVRKAARVRGEARAAARTRATSSVLASGRWVKIAVTKNGVHKLTPAALAAMGFSNPSAVRIFGYGGHLLQEELQMDAYYDDLPEVPWVKAADGGLLFWANGLTSGNYDTESPQHTHNYCAREACYFLTDGTPKTMTVEPSSANTPQQTLTSVPQHVVLDKDEYAWASFGRKLYESASTANGTARTYVLNTPTPVGGKSGLMRICFAANVTSTVTLTPTVNGEKKTEMKIGAHDDYDKAREESALYYVPMNGNTTTVQLTPGSAYEGRLDFIELTYARHLSMAGADEIVFHPTANGTTAFSVSGMTSATQLWRQPEPGLEGARIMPAADGTFVVDDACHNYVLVNTSASFPEPVMVGAIANQNLHAVGEDVDMVIITPASGIFDGEATRLAEAHAASDGLRCKVVRADHIYNEFSSGTPDVSAYRLYMKMLYDNQKQAPRYVLLFGDCAADNRMLTAEWRNFSPDNFLLCYESDNSVSDTKSYMTDDFIGMMDEGEGANPLTSKADISVGRFPVRDVTEAATMVNKTIAHLQSAVGAWNNRVAYLGDDGDENSHMEYADWTASAVESTAPDIDVTRVMWDAYKRVSSTVTNTFPDVVKTINRLNNEGVLMFNYTGHGATYVLSHESVVKLSDVKAWSNTHYPLWYTAACDVMPIDGTAENIGEAAVLNPKGGAVAFVGTTRTVYASSNYTLNRNFSTLLFDCDEQGRRYSVGDALRLAKTSSGVASTTNKMQYVLAGDPSLVFGNPSNKIVLDSINGKAVEEQLLRAGSRATMTGHVVDAKGEALTTFDGALTMRVLDSKVKVTCHNAAKAKKGAFVYEDRNKVLYSGVDSVKAGKFSFSFVVPVDINYSNEAGRVSFYASAGKIEANGHNTAFNVGGISNELANDTLGPKVFITLGDENFVEGSSVCPTPLFLAQLYDDNGINVSGNGIGHDLELSIDGKGATTYNLNDYFSATPGDFRSGEVAYVIPELAPGSHTLTFRAWDLLNNPTTSTLSFVVDPDFKTNVTQVTMSPNPAKTHANIFIIHNSAGSDITAEANIYDYSGRLIKTLTASSTQATPTVCLRWDFNSAEGAGVATGVYLVRVKICRNGVWSDGATQKLFVLKQ